MISIDVRDNFKSVEKNLGFLAKKQLPRARVTAINRTANGVRTEAVKFAKEYIGKSDIKVKELRSKTHIYRASAKYRQYAVITFRRAIFPLKRFKPKQTPKGIVASAFGQTKLYRGTFFATVGKGEHKGIFKRMSKARLPIKELWGSDFQKIIFKNKKVLSSIKKRIKKQLPLELTRALKAIAMRPAKR